MATVILESTERRKRALAFLAFMQEPAMDGFAVVECVSRTRWSGDGWEGATADDHSRTVRPASIKGVQMSRQRVIKHQASNIRRLAGSFKNRASPREIPGISGREWSDEVVTTFTCSTKSATSGKDTKML